MELSIETRLDVLKTAMQEDRTEIRLIKEQIRSTCPVITASSFPPVNMKMPPKMSDYGLAGAQALPAWSW
jgi:hypothetical protein